MQRENTTIIRTNICNFVMNIVQSVATTRWPRVFFGKALATVGEIQED